MLHETEIKTEKGTFTVYHYDDPAEGMGVTFRPAGSDSTVDLAYIHLSDDDGANSTDEPKDYISIKIYEDPYDEDYTRSTQIPIADIADACESGYIF